MRIRVPAVVAVLGLLPADALADPLHEFLGSAGGSICYERVYDQAHLNRLPKQDTKSLRLSLSEDTYNSALVRVVIEGKARTSVIVGGCEWMEPANRDIMDEPILDTFKARSGLDCNALSSVDGMSAEEGGYFAIDLRDGRSIHLHLPDSIAAWPSMERDYEAAWVEFGTDDRVFRVDLAGASRCAPMNAQLPGLE